MTRCPRCDSPLDSAEPQPFCGCAEQLLDAALDDAKAAAAHDCDPPDVEARFALFERLCPDFLTILADGTIEALRAAGQLHCIFPIQFPAALPPWVPLPFPGECVDAYLIILHAIRDPYERAEQILAANVRDDCERARLLIMSVADAGWPGAIAQGLLRPSADDVALQHSLDDLHKFLRGERLRISRSMETNAAAWLREFRKRRFPAMYQKTPPPDPGLLQILRDADDFENLPEM